MISFLLGWVAGVVSLFLAVRPYRRRWASSVLDAADTKVRKLELVRLRFGRTVFVPALVEMRPGPALIDATLLELAFMTRFGGDHIDFLDGGWFLELTSMADALPLAE